MKHQFRFFALLIVFFLAISIPAFAADSLTLANGRTIKGRIVSENSGKITIQIAGGEVSFKKSQIKSVSYGKRTKQRSALDENNGKTQTASQKGKRKKKKKSKNLKAKLATILAEIKGLNLASWEQEQSTVVYGGGKRYRIIRFGQEEFADKLPDHSTGTEKVYVRSNPTGFSYVATQKGRQFVWKRLYWDQNKKKWLTTHPAHSTFNKEQTLVNRFLSEVNKANGVPYRIPILLSSLRSARNDTKKYEYTIELNTLTDKVGAAWGGSQLMRQVYQIEMAIPKAPVHEKVNLAIQRRDLLGAIAEQVKEE